MRINELETFIDCNQYATGATMVMQKIILLLTAFLLAGVVHGHENKPTYDRINLSVAASQKVEQDTLYVVLAAQHQAKQSAEAADQVNRKMQWAMDQATKNKSIVATTLGYHTQPLYDKHRIKGWRVRQSLQLESKKPDQLTKLLAVLQEQLEIESIGYSLSKQRRTSIETELVNQAIAAFTARAKQVQLQLGRDDYRIVQLNLGSSRPQPFNQYRRGRVMMADASAGISPPTVKAGETEINVSADGTIELTR